jgi:hypothetical protein
MMAAIGATIGPDGELALVQWKEQFVLFADRPVTHFGYFRTDTEQEARQAAAWALASPHRFVLLPRESLTPCFLADRCQDLGHHYRRDWFLAPVAAIGPACGGPPPPLAAPQPGGAGGIATPER